MASLIRANAIAPQAPPRAALLPVALVIAVAAAFLLMPGDLTQKTHLALHGICAQRPTHSLHMGGETLPLDARMSGIYIGALVSSAWLLAAGRLRAAGSMGRSVVILLATFVAIMAIDGGNALLVDLALPHPYEPSNALRMATGVLAGTTLGVALSHLFAITMWRGAHRHTPIVARPQELVVPLLVAAALGGLALTGLPVLYAPFAIGLVAAAVAVFTVLGLVLLALLTGRAWRMHAYGEMAGLSAVAWLGAVVALALLSAARLAAEQYLGLPQLT